MTEDKDSLEPNRPTGRAPNRYAAFGDNRGITVPPSPADEPQTSRADIFSVNITASIKGKRMNGTTLNEQQFLIDLIFKPLDPKLKLRPEETQLLLSYIGEILKGIEREEQKNTEEEKKNPSLSANDGGIL